MRYSSIPNDIRARLFRSFFLGGFECSSHRLANGRRLDLIDATCHDRFAALDYARLFSMGIQTARDGIRWHLTEPSPGRYEFSSFTRMLRAARDHGIQVIWDLFHYGWPDDLDIFSPAFVDRFSKFAAATARVVHSETDEVPYYVPVNEISFFAWGAGEAGILNPFEKSRGHDVKAQLVRAHIAAIEAIRDVDRRARFVQIDPLIHIVTEPWMSPRDIEYVEGHLRGVYDAWDMVCGRREPELGGREEYLDIIGANYYVHNQWVYQGKFIEPTDPRYRPLRNLLADLYRRYDRPLFLAETGIEDERRPEWLAYVCDEVAAALQSGTPIEGICLYPIVNHPGWDDDRHCHNGLWDYCNSSGDREVYRPLADEITRQCARFSLLQRELERDRVGELV